jgi:glycosyltransferase involved in cell wall biosynthesis
MNLPLVSICTPTFHRPAYLKELIGSVLAQHYQDWEMIIRDNSENDETARMMASITDPRIRYLRNERNLGIGGNVQRCLDEARGDFLTFTPDDDVWHPDNLLKKVTFLVANADLDVVFSNAERMDAAGRPMRRFQSTWTPGPKRLPSMELRPCADAVRQHFVQIATVMMRRSLLPVFRESWHLNTEEYFMWWLGCRDKDLGYLGDPLVTLREAEHFRTTVQDGKVVDYSNRADIRQRQLVDFYRSLLIFHPEIKPVLESDGVKRFVADAVLSSAATAFDLVRGAALAATGVGGDAGLAAMEMAARLMGRIPLHPPAQGDASGIGPVER